MDYAQIAQQQLASLQSQYAQLMALQNQMSGKASTGNPAVSTPAVPSSTVPQPILFVDGGIEGARKLHMEPNTTIAVFDRNDSLFYLRSMDANGQEAPMKIGRFTLEDAPTPEDNTLTRKDLEDFKAEIRTMIMAGYTDAGKKRKPEPTKSEEAEK